jgi:putative nucleotidyltransferase with HDIG domain
VTLERRLAAERDLRAVREALAGREAWLVGGSVRDLLLDRPLRDVDVAVAGDPEAAARAVGAAIDGPVFRLSEAFGAWRALDRQRGVACDVATLQGATIGDDLAARDFTVNAMAVPLEGGALLDPSGGERDLGAGVLRVVGPGAYEADPLRPLRLARLAAELGFAPDADTERLTRSAAAGVSAAAPERVLAELRLLVVARHALDGLRLADRLGLLAAVLPEVSELHGVEQSSYHHLDVFDHTLEVLARQVELEGGALDELLGPLAPRLRELLDEPLADDLTRAGALRFGALLHDVGKPSTRAVRPDGRVTFIGHDAAGQRMVEALCRRLRASARLGSFLGALARHHLVLGFMVHRRPLSRRDVYRYLRLTTPVEVEVTLLTCADRLATRGKNADAAIAAHLDLARELMGAALDWRSAGPPRAPIRGDELARALGIEPGPELGRLVASLEEAASTGEATTPDEAVAFARRLREDPPAA